MSVIYLQHPKHGTKVATDEVEAENDRKRGWKDFDPEAPVEKPAEVVASKTLTLPKESKPDARAV